MSDGGKGDKRRPGDDQAFSENFDLIFGSSEVKRGKFVWDEDRHEFVPYDEYVPQSNVNVMIMPDIQPYQSMVDGSMITSRSKHREHLRRNHLIEIGNETKHLKAFGDYKPKGIKEDLVREFQRVKEQGRLYKK